MTYTPSRDSTASDASLGPLIIDVAGTELQEEDRELLAHPQVGGIILFSRNYESPEQLTALVQSIRRVNPSQLICVDHEGGRVQRFRQGFTQVPAMQTLGSQYQTAPSEALTLARNIAWLLASELLAFDIDISFAPVLDVDHHHSDIIGDRAFDNNPETTATIARAFIGGMHEAGMAATGKHFPGHGGVKADSHLELPYDKRDLQTVEKRDIVPFKALINELDAIMPAHIVFPEIDAEPVGFSHYWLQQYLRQELKFNGIIFSDDLSMEGAAIAGDYPQRAKTALAAGCDAILVCNRRQEAIATLEYLESCAYVRPNHSPKLESLRAKQQLCPSQLKAQDRWQQTAAAIDKLTALEERLC